MFSLKLKSEQFEIEQQDGSVKTYEIKELNGRELEDYLNSTRNNVILTNGKVTGMKTFDGMYTNLLMRCTYLLNGDAVLKPDLDLWPSSLQKDLFDIAQRLSKLGSDDESKNG